jgi:GSH-dependent disulfide-bond oxidoreductase
MPHPIALYYFGSPNSRKVTIMLEELGVPYTIVPIQMSRGDTKREDYDALAPSQKMPVLVDPEGPEGKAVSIFESGAILKYLAEKHGRFYGSSWAERIKIDEWLFWQVGGFGPMLGQANHFARYAREKIPYAIDRYINETHRLYRVLNAQLERQARAGKSYVASDDVSIADFAILDWSNGYANYAIEESEFPYWLAWRARMKKRPAVARALAITLPERPIDLATDAEAQKVLFGQR